MITLARVVAEVNKTKNVSHVNIVFGKNQILHEMPKMLLNVWSLSEEELLPFLTLNLYGFDPVLEAGSR